MPELVKFWLELDKVPPELGEVLAELKHLFDILAQLKSSLVFRINYNLPKI